MRRLNYYPVFILFVLFTSCKKNNESEEEVVPTPATSLGYFFKADFNGVTKTFSTTNSYVNFYGPEIFLPDSNGNINVMPKAGLLLSGNEIMSLQFIYNVISVLKTRIKVL